MTPVELVALPAAFDGIEESLKAYPPGFYASLCKAIFVCGSMTIEGASAGGTYGRAWIVLVARPSMGEGGTYQTARLGVHHEFSSLVWPRIATLPARWNETLPPGWKPARDNAEALAAAEQGDAPLRDGFLSTYGATSTENDFNTYAELLLTLPQTVAQLADQHAVIASKVALVMAAYELLEPRMAAVFDRSQLQRFRSALGPPLEQGFSLPAFEIPAPEIIRPGG